MTQNKIIEFLRASDGYISGEVISRQLNLSRAAIWKSIEELRRDGYDIEASPRQGYILKSAPDKLLPQEIKDGLKTNIMGKEIHYFDEVESTMDVAFRLAIDGVAEGTLTCAETQTKGRGRMGRTWSSPKGKGIYASLILRPKLSPTQVSKLTLLSAVAVCEAIQSTCEVKVDIKWPNDLLIGGKKIAGFLTELSAEMDQVKFVVVGFGINVNTTLPQLPAGSTSLKVESKKTILRVELLKNILISFDHWYQRIFTEGFEPVMAAWKTHSSMLGRNIAFNDGQKTIEGMAMGLDEYGGLIIRTRNGEVIKRMSGDVIEVTT